MRSSTTVYGRGRTRLYVQRKKKRGFAKPLLWALAIALAVGILTGGNAGAEEIERHEPSARSGRAAVLELAERHFPPHLVGWAMRTAHCETGGTYDLYARSAGYDRSWRVYYDFNGPWQVDAVTWGAKAWQLFGGPLAEPEVGAAMAAWIATNLGRSHWPVCGYRGGW